ncbi:hypothetical protein QZH41_003838 [Actinostola sp. cb2023]|nr:hypothetical protein QZH41_003838 [Actinostola sp. cb2023]
MSQDKKMSTLKRRLSTSSVHTLETPKKKLFASLPGDFAYEVIPVERTDIKLQDELENAKSQVDAGQFVNEHMQNNVAPPPPAPQRRILIATKASASRKRKFFAQFSQGEMLGAGSFGKVYAGIRLRDQLPVAIKYVPKDTCRNVQAGPYQNIPAEIFFQRNLHHSNIIRLIEHHYFDNNYVLVFERPSVCTDLFEYLENYEKNAINEEEGRKIFREILDAVMYLDRQGILHHDIKTENIIMDLSNGTPEFSPPEYHMTQQYDGRQATVWSLGCFLFDMLTGNPPYHNARQAAILPLTIPTHLSQDLQSFLGIVLEKRPTERARLGDLLEHPWLRTA